MEPMPTIPEFADWYGVTQRTVRNWIANGDIVAYRVGPRLIRIDPLSGDLICKPYKYQGRTSPVEKKTPSTSERDMSKHIDSDGLESESQKPTKAPDTKGKSAPGSVPKPRTSNGTDKSRNAGDANE